MYRATRVDYQYSTGDDDWQSPFDYESSGGSDPRRAAPAPHVEFEKRILQQTFRYDWLGNSDRTDDDAHGFYDRSLGTITNGSDEPYQLEAAVQTGGTHNGSLTTDYDAAGNLIGLSVNRDGVCLPAGADCNQTFVYAWDEVGRLSRAQRFDGAAGTPAADLRHYYDASDQRVIKRATVGSDDRYTLYLFDTLELRRAQFGNYGEGVTDDYEYTEDTAVPYLLANGVRLARVMWEIAPIPSVTAGQAHVFFELGDHLGSTSVVLDQATGELVERATFQAYGGAESDYRPSRWAGFREDYRFTGKEEDVEVGLQYFGKRFLNPLLGRWVSADPLGVHVPGEADWNLYAYVEGYVLKAVDPHGLQTYSSPEDAEWGVPESEGWSEAAPATYGPEHFEEDLVTTGRHPHHNGVYQVAAGEHPDYKGTQTRKAAAAETVAVVGEISLTALDLAAPGTPLGELNVARRAARTVRAVNAYEHSATIVRRTGRVFAQNVGLDVGSSSVIRSGVIRALRQSGDPNALATAKAISTGRLELKLGRIPDARKPQGRYGWKDTIEVDTTNLTGRQAAGFAAHEGKHWADGLKPSTYFMDKYRYEFDAYKVQESVDPGMRKLYEIDSGDNALMEFVKKYY